MKKEHPLVCYDGMTGYLTKIQLRDGTQYSCIGVVGFLQPIPDEYLNDYPEIRIQLRGDSVFATTDLYKQREENGIGYEHKFGFDFAYVSSHTRKVNADGIRWEQPELNSLNASHINGSYLLIRSYDSLFAATLACITASALPLSPGSVSREASLTNARPALYIDKYG